MNKEYYLCYDMIEISKFMRNKFKINRYAYIWLTQSECAYGWKQLFDYSRCSYVIKSSPLLLHVYDYHVFYAVWYWAICWSFPILPSLLRSSITYDFSLSTVKLVQNSIYYDDFSYFFRDRLRKIIFNSLNITFFFYFSHLLHTTSSFLWHLRLFTLLFFRLIYVYNFSCAKCISHCIHVFQWRNEKNEKNIIQTFL